MAEHTMDHGSTESKPRRKHRHEGPRNHLLAFVLSILLTAFAFLAVAYALVEEETHVEHWWVYVFIIALAIFQAIVQLGYWMHMKDKGHGWPTFGIAFGFFVALTAAAAGLLWSWW